MSSNNFFIVRGFSFENGYGIFAAAGSLSVLYIHGVS